MKVVQVWCELIFLDETLSIRPMSNFEIFAHDILIKDRKNIYRIQKQSDILGPNLDTSASKNIFFYVAVAKYC